MMMEMKVWCLVGRPKIGNVLKSSVVGCPEIGVVLKR